MKVSVITVVFLFGLLGRGLSQVVVIGPDGKSGPPPATREYCLSMETFAPNLKLAQDTAVRGMVSDQSNAPLTHSAVELRKFISESKQVTVKKVFTDDSGLHGALSFRPLGFRFLLDGRIGILLQGRSPYPLGLRS